MSSLGPYRESATISPPAGTEDIPIRLFNKQMIVLQRTGPKTAVYQGENWFTSDGIFWWKEKGLRSC